jgi:glycosyltransferase involved in cell wall biosynthesis
VAPKISIVIPLHNKGDFIAQAIESVMKQTLAAWEMIIVDNYSSDNGPNIACSFAERDSRMQLLKAPLEIRGPGAARNYGLERASGEWILFLDADDLIESNHLESLLAKAECSQSANVIAGGWKEFRTENPAKLISHRPACCNRPRGNLLGYSIAFAPWAVHAALIRREAITRELLWPEDLDRLLGEDIHFWFRLILQNPVVFCESAGALYRTHTRNRRNQLHEITKWHEGLDAAVKANISYLKNHGQTPTSLEAQSLCTLYSELYWQAKIQKAKAIQFACIDEAKKWQRLAIDLHPKPSLKMKVEKLLGIKTSIALRALFK